MFNVASCDGVITDDIINEIKRLYAIKPLPDLYFYIITEVKKGIYLDLDFTLKNQGLIDAENVYVNLYHESKQFESFDLNTIKFGAGKSIITENIKLPSKSVEQIIIKIESESEELDKNNNVVEFVLGG